VFGAKSGKSKSEATFGREIGAASLQRMTYGPNYGNVKLNEDGSINPQGAE